MSEALAKGWNSSCEKGELRTVGVIVGSHGLRGAVKVESLSDFPERFAHLSRVTLKGSGGDLKHFFVQHSKWSGGLLLMKFSECSTREDAEALRGFELCVPDCEAWPLPVGRYYVSDLIGLNVWGEDGSDLGLVEEILSAGHDVLRIAGRFGELLIPLVEDWVSSINLEFRRIEIRDWRRLVETESISGGASADDH